MATAPPGRHGLHVAGGGHGGGRHGHRQPAGTGAIGRDAECHGVDTDRLAAAHACCLGPRTGRRYGLPVAWFERPDLGLDRFEPATGDGSGHGPERAQHIDQGVAARADVDRDRTLGPDGHDREVAAGLSAGVDVQVGVGTDRGPCGRHHLRPAGFGSIDDGEVHHNGGDRAGDATEQRLDRYVEQRPGACGGRSTPRVRPRWSGGYRRCAAARRAVRRSSSASPWPAWAALRDARRRRRAWSWSPASPTGRRRRVRRAAKARGAPGRASRGCNSNAGNAGRGRRRRARCRLNTP